LSPTENVLVFFTWLTYVHLGYIVYTVRRCWAPVEGRHSKSVWRWWWWWWWWCRICQL